MHREIRESEILGTIPRSSGLSQGHNGGERQKPWLPCRYHQLLIVCPPVPRALLIAMPSAYAVNAGILGLLWPDVRSKPRTGWAVWANVRSTGRTFVRPPRAL
ncbi:hypothetical protein FB451DRAFT_1193771 [Mycena latifolia]|nr:hypothetical protein FB451DRAFT_1193771 [Mycena latifolia]